MDAAEEAQLRSDVAFHADFKDKSLSLKDMMRTFLRADVDAEDADRITDVMAHAAATPRGTYEGQTQVLAERARDAGVAEPQVPSWSTYRRALKEFGQPLVERGDDAAKDPEPVPVKRELSEKDFTYTEDGTFRKDVRLDYDPRRVNQHFDCVNRANFHAGRDLVQLKDRLWVVNKDGNPHPLYAESWRYGIAAERYGPQTGKDYTLIGQLGSGAVRSKRGVSYPMYAGTMNKLEYFVMSAHFIQTNETFCLAFRFGAPNPMAQVSMLEALRSYEDAPLLMMSDKGFASEEFTRNDRNYCDPRGVIMITPLPRWAWIREIMADIWNSGEAKPVPGAGKTLLFGQRREHWGDLKVHPFNVACFYTEEDPREDLDDPDAFEVFELAPKLFAVAFYTNLEVDCPEVALWFEAQYSGRWACENLFKRAKALLGRSQSHGPFHRHLAYGYGMLAFAALGLWRLRRRIRLDFWAAWIRGISRNLFLDPMKGFIERRFEAQDK